METPNTTGDSHLDEGKPGDDGEARAEGGQHPPVTRGQGQVTLQVVISVCIRDVNEVLQVFTVHGEGPLLEDTLLNGHSKYIDVELGRLSTEII